MISALFKMHQSGENGNSDIYYLKCTRIQEKRVYKISPAFFSMFCYYSPLHQTVFHTWLYLLCYLPPDVQINMCMSLFFAVNICNDFPLRKAQFCFCFFYYGPCACQFLLDNDSFEAESECDSVPALSFRLYL